MFASKEAWEVALEEMPRGKPATVVGISDSVTRDATTLFLLRTTPEVNIADPRYYNDGRDLIEENPAGPVAGIRGGVSYHFDQLRTLRDAGLSLAPYVWLGRTSGVLNIPVADNSQGVVGDHNTSAHVLWNHKTYLFESGSADEYAAVREAFFSEAFIESRRVLASGGVLFFQIDLATKARVLGYENGRQLKNKLLDAMEQAGFDASYMTVVDRWKISLTTAEAAKLQDVVIPNNFGNARVPLRNYIRSSWHEQALVFETPWWPGPDLFLGKKL